nr:ARID DNA-binding domain-containing protein [Tanacetum cinerariifolium]
MLKRKIEEIELYNTTINQPKSHNTFRRHKCFKCRQRRYIVKNCPVKKQDEGAENIQVKSEIAKASNEGFKASKPSVSIKYPKSIHLETKCMLKWTDQGHWDDIWYVSNNTNVHLCSKLSLLCNIREKFTANKLDDQMKFLFTYGLGEVVINNGDKGYLILGVSYTPEVTLNILSLELLERQGFEITYENNTCSLVYMFKDPKGQNFNEDRLRVMHNKYLEEYFEALDGSAEQNNTLGLISMQDDVIEIKGTLYSTKVTTFNEVPKEEHNTILSMPTGTVEKASKKGKEKMKRLRIKLEDTRYEPDSLSPIHLSIKGIQTMNKDNQGMIKGPIKSEFEVKEEIDSNSSEGPETRIIRSCISSMLAFRPRPELGSLDSYIRLIKSEKSKPWNSLRRKWNNDFIYRKLKREKEQRWGNQIRKITNDCKEMLKRKIEEIELYNTTINQPKSHNTFRRHKCFKCRQRGYIVKIFPVKKQDEGAEKIQV